MIILTVSSYVCYACVVLVVHSMLSHTVAQTVVYLLTLACILHIYTHGKCNLGICEEPK